MLLFVCSETTESKISETGDELYGDTSPNSKYSLC